MAVWKPASDAARVDGVQPLRRRSRADPGCRARPHSPRSRAAPRDPSAPSATSFTARTVRRCCGSISGPRVNQSPVFESREHHVDAGREPGVADQLAVQIDDVWRDARIVHHREPDAPHLPVGQQQLLRSVARVTAAESAGRRVTAPRSTRTPVGEPEASRMSRPPARIRRLARDRRRCKGAAVRQCGMAVDPSEEHRVSWRRGVERTGRGPVGDRPPVLIPAAAEDPLALAHRPQRARAPWPR